MKNDEIRQHDARLKRLTDSFRRKGISRRLEDFYCPILQVEEPAALCKGHIIPKSVRGRSWVVQRKDVDNFFGSFSEAGFAHGVKLRSMEFRDGLEYVTKHHLAKDANLSVVGGNGVKARVHPTKKRGGGWEFRVQLEDGQPDLSGELSLSMNMDVGCETLLTCLHSAHLGNFEAAGYTYATSPSGRFVASLLGQVYRRFTGASVGSRRGAKADRAQLEDLCRMHMNMVRPLPSVEGFNKELLEDPFRSFVVGWCGGKPFATIHQLQADSEWNAVMVYAEMDGCAIAMIRAKTPVSFKATIGRLRDGFISVGPVREDSSTLVWPCGNYSNGVTPMPIEEVVAQVL